MEFINGIIFLTLLVKAIAYRKKQNSQLMITDCCAIYVKCYVRTFIVHSLEFFTRLRYCDDFYAITVYNDALTRYVHFLNYLQHKQYIYGDYDAFNFKTYVL